MVSEILDTTPERRHWWNMFGLFSPNASGFRMQQWNSAFRRCLKFRLIIKQEFPDLFPQCSQPHLIKPSEHKPIFSSVYAKTCPRRECCLMFWFVLSTVRCKYGGSIVSTSIHTQTHTFTTHKPGPENRTRDSSFEKHLLKLFPVLQTCVVETCWMPEREWGRVWLVLHSGDPICHG